MPRLLVIADDLTGAAEIAGVGRRYGLAARLVRRPVARGEPGLTVIDTDSRLLPPGEAARVVASFVRDLPRSDVHLLYKKTDSVLRGPVRAELEALMAVLGRPAALLVPQNPSRGRTISADGTYRIGGVPLDRTAFADDPDHPARSARATDLLGLDPAACIEPGGDVPASGITIGAAASEADVNIWAGRVTGSVFPAGGADFFGAILGRLGLRASRDFETALPDGPALFVCGSAAGAARDWGRTVTCAMPDSDDVPSIERWAAAACDALAATGRVALVVRRLLDRSPGASQRIQVAIADAAARVMARCRVTSVLAEGGATAAALCRRMGWDDLVVRGELAGGVVRMAVRGDGEPHLVIKPGSYPWPEVVLR